MGGIEERLRNIEGVGDIQLELGDEGLQSIRVTLSEGGDEAEVLDEVRRILAAYGLRSRRDLRRVWARPGSTLGPGSVSPTLPEEPSVSVRRVEEGLEVEARLGERVIVRREPATPTGAARAMAAAWSALHGGAAPHVDGAGVAAVGAHRVVVVVVVRSGREPVAGCALLSNGLTDALWRAVAAASQAA